MGGAGLLSRGGGEGRGMQEGWQGKGANCVGSYEILEEYLLLTLHEVGASGGFRVKEDILLTDRPNGSRT